MKLLLIATLLWGPNLYAKVDTASSTAEVIYPNTPSPHRNNPSVNPVPDPIDEKNVDQTLDGRRPTAQEEREEPRYNTTPKPRTSRPIGPNKK